MRKIGSTPPNTTHSTTYSGKMKNAASQKIPGAASAAQSLLRRSRDGGAARDGAVTRNGLDSLGSITGTAIGN